MSSKGTKTYKIGAFFIIISKVHVNTSDLIIKIICFLLGCLVFMVGPTDASWENKLNKQADVFKIRRVPSH